MCVCASKAISSPRIHFQLFHHETMQEIFSFVCVGLSAPSVCAWLVWSFVFLLLPFYVLRFIVDPSKFMPFKCIMKNRKYTLILVRRRHLLPRSVYPSFLLRQRSHTHTQALWVLRGENMIICTISRWFLVDTGMRISEMLEYVRSVLRVFCA